METFSALLALCAGNSPVTGEFPSQRPVTRNFDVFLHVCLNKRLSKQSWGWLFETPSCSLWRHCNWITFVVYSPFITLSWRICFTLIEYKQELGKISDILLLIFWNVTFNLWSLHLRDNFCRPQWWPACQPFGQDPSVKNGLAAAERYHTLVAALKSVIYEHILYVHIHI